MLQVVDKTTWLEDDYSWQLFAADEILMVA